MNLKSKLILISGALFLMGCTSVENKVLDIPTYSKEKKVYSILDNKPINGVIEKDGYNRSKEYYTYKKGILSNLKKINMDNELILDQSFDHMGLFQGRSTGEKGKTSEYFHGVLDGEVRYEDYNGDKIVERYSDGVLNGIQETKSGKKLFFSQGIRSVEDTQSMTKRQPKTAVWGEIPKENFTGKLYGKPKKEIKGIYYAEFQIEEYIDGDLLSRRYYNKKGQKLDEFHFAGGDIKKIIKSIKYRNGILMKLKNYDSDGNLNGRTFTGSDYTEFLFIQNFVNGIPHGKVEMLIKEDDKLVGKTGFYDKGIYSGYLNGQYYKDGIEVEEEFTDLVFSSLVITNIKNILNKKTFSGYTKGDINNGNNLSKDLYYYENGFLKEKYEYENNSLTKSEHYKKNGSYIHKDYYFGVVRKILNYNDEGIAHGKYMGYEHENSKTVGNMVDGVIDGKSVHYHGDKIYYVDLYRKGNEYERTIYYNYDKRQVLQTQKGVKTNIGWIKAGLDKTYYESGKLKKIINYGDDLSSTKKVEVTKYYLNGKVQSKGTMDYRLYKNIGLETEFYENGKKKLEQNYDDRGINVGIKKYYFSNGKIKKIENYNDRGYRDGSFKTYNEDGKLIEELQYQDGYKK